MQIQDLDRIFEKQGEKLAEAEANSALEGVDKQEQAEFAARQARETKGRSIERRFNRTRGHFRSFMHLTADWTRDVRGRKIVMSPLINLGSQTSPQWGEGRLTACVMAQADNGWLTGYKVAQRFVTQTCFKGSGDDQPAHEVKTETFGYGPPFMPKLSGWRTQIDRRQYRLVE